MKKIEVVAAIIINGKEILCTQRNHNKYNYIAYKYEFPGGKIEDGETHIEALEREIAEEMGAKINIRNEDFFMKVHHNYPDFCIVLHSYIYRTNNFQFNLSEHINYSWCDRNTINKLDWASADIPIVNKIITEGLI